MSSPATEKLPARFAAGAQVIRATLAQLPSRPGVYRMCDDAGHILYIGKAKNLKHRVGSYAHANRLPLRLQRMVARLAHIEITLTKTETEALLLEANLIKKHQPPYNVLLKDAKDYAYLLIATDHPFPLLTKHRGAQRQKGHYFGPFASAQSVNETLEVLQKAFLLRNCPDSVFKNRTRPCLQHDIKRCTAPCVGKVSEREYAQQVDMARRFFSGQTQKLTQDLASQMEAASAAQHYERAALLRDRIRALAAVKARQEINLDEPTETDLFALGTHAGQSAIQVFFFRQGRNFGGRVLFPTQAEDAEPGAILSSFLGQFYLEHPLPEQILLSHPPDDIAILRAAFREKAGHAVRLHTPERGKLLRMMELAAENAQHALQRRQSDQQAQEKSLQGLAATLGLAAPPRRIEIYDNSHIQGTNAIGAMVAAGPDGFIRSAYRKFTMRGAQVGEHRAGDDPAMMQEMLRRRFKEGAALREHAPEQWPDLLLLDGGPSQLQAGLEALADLGLSDLPVVAIAKGPERNKGREKIYRPGAESPLSLAPHDPVLFFLQRLRDEAHRFAIGTHRARRQKQQFASALDSVPGIGPTRKKALLAHFGSAQAVAAAQIADLRKVAGISVATARQIYDHFHPHG